MFECIVCGRPLSGGGEVLISEYGPVALCSDRCRRVFSRDPEAYVSVAAEAELGGGD
jgi:hypothetical protein